MSRMFTRSDSMVDQTSAGSRVWVRGGMTTVLPPHKALKASQWAAPCMNGGAGIMRTPPLRALSTIWSRSAHS